MGRHRRRHKHKNKQPQQKPACGHAKCDGQCKSEEPQAEIVEIETQAELQELLDLIMDAGAERSERWQRKQKELNNALLTDVGIPIPPEEPAKAVEPAAVDDSAI